MWKELDLTLRIFFINWNLYLFCKLKSRFLINFTWNKKLKYKWYRIVPGFTDWFYGKIFFIWSNFYGIISAYDKKVVYS